MSQKWFGLTLGMMLLFGQMLSAAEPVATTKVLMLTQSKGFQHSSVKRTETDLAVSEVAMIQLGKKTGLFAVECSQNAEIDLTRENLQNYQVVMFYTTGELPISPDNRDYFINDWLKQPGHGFIGFHSAADTYRTNDPQKNAEFRWYWEMVGGTFNGHPWNAGTTVTMKIHEPEHPIIEPFGKQFVIKDEIYQYVNWQPEKVRVLMSLDMSACQPQKPYHVPVAWVKNWGEGKVYFNNLGHREETWTQPEFLESITRAVRWIRGDIIAAAEPNPEVSAQEEMIARQISAE